MSVFYLDWGSDFVIAPNGGLLQANGWDEARQLTVRSLLTNAGRALPDGTLTAPDYIFVPDYGVGLGLYVGQDMTPAQKAALQSLISAAILAQTFVDPSVEPNVAFTSTPDYAMLIAISLSLISNQQGTIVIAQN